MNPPPQDDIHLRNMNWVVRAVVAGLGVMIAGTVLEIDPMGLAGALVASVALLAGVGLMIRKRLAT